MRNLKLAYRTLFRTPLVTGVAVLSLALGIGANAAIYSLFHELLLAPLPVPHPEQLVNFGGNTPTPGGHQTTLAGGDAEWVFSFAMFRDLEAQPEAGGGPFTGVAGHQDFTANVAFRGNTVNANAEYVSGLYFPVLGVRPALGRLFGPDDDKVVGGNPFVLLSHSYWTNQLGGDPSIIGQVMMVNGQALRIMGVAAAGFEGTTLGKKPDFFVPLTMRGALEGFKGFENRRRYWVYVFGRLRPGVTIAQAQARENILFHRIVNDIEVPLQTGVSEKTLTQFKAKQLRLVDGRRGSSDLHEQTEMPMLLLFGTTLFVLVIACANIANLLLARAANRSTEIAVRLSLGATRKQLLVQLLTESVLLAALGGLAGVVVAWATLRGLVVLLPGDVSSALSFTLDGNAIAVAGVLSIATGLLFGLFPALHSTRPDLVAALRSGSGKTSATRGATRFRTSLVTAQIALSMALLASAGLFIKSLANVSRVRLGVDIDGVTTFGVAPALNGYSGTHTQQLYSAIERELAAIPGVRGVAAARVPILGGDNWDNDVSVTGFAKTPDTDADAYFNAVSPEFFHTMGEPMASGRDFTAADALGAPRVAIVNETFTKKFGLGSNAVGKMMGQGDSLTHLIVGVVKDSRYSGVKQKMRPVFFLPYKQDTTSMGNLSFYVRSAADPTAVMGQIRAAVARVDRTLPIVGLKTMPQQIRDNVYLDRMITTLTAAFAALATLLAAIGLYGVLAYSVVQRTKEIGVRIALGADTGTIVRMVLRHVAVMTVAGAAIGVIGALGIGRATESLLFGVAGRDPLVMLAAMIAMASVALAAGSIPAWRAARVDPVRALKYE
jgi:predicted permease